MSKNNYSQKYKDLQARLADMQSILVAFSGGVDSSVLLRMAHDAGIPRLLAATINSPTFTEAELDRAESIAKDTGVEYRVITVDELVNPDFVANTPERCYYCKHLRYKHLKSLQHELDLAQIVDGTNLDDMGDWRPGLRAAKELGIRSPLAEAGFTKTDIRELAHQLGLSNWDAPSNACLASRIPYGQEITHEKLVQIKAAEEFLKGLGYSQVRVRHHGDLARIEVPEDQISSVVEYSAELETKLRDLGFMFVTIDLSGLKSGSLNAALNNPHKVTTAE